jgi:hypothetical protein
MKTFELNHSTNIFLFNDIKIIFYQQRNNYIHVYKDGRKYRFENNYM